MNEIVDLAQYRNAKGALEEATDGIVSLPCSDEANDAPSGLPQGKTAVRAGLRLCKSLAAFGKRASWSFNRSRSFDELSPHLQWDIGMIDVRPPLGHGPWHGGAMTGGGSDQSWRYGAGRW